MLIEEEATEIAKSYLRSRLGHDLEIRRVHFWDVEDIARLHHMAGYTEEAVGCMELRSYWSIAFQAFFPGGNPMDECLWVKVDALNGSASFNN